MFLDLLNLIPSDGLMHSTNMPQEYAYPPGVTQPMEATWTSPPFYRATDILEAALFA